MASYKQAIKWLALNDDCEWLKDYGKDDCVSISVSAALVADLFNKSDEQVEKDLRKQYATEFDKDGNLPLIKEESK